MSIFLKNNVFRLTSGNHDDEQVVQSVAVLGLGGLMGASAAHIRYSAYCKEITWFNYGFILILYLNSAYLDLPHIMSRLSSWCFSYHRCRCWGLGG